MSFLENLLPVSPLFLLIFFSLVTIAIIIDFIFLNKEPDTTISLKKATIWSAIWIGIALLFNVGLWSYFSFKGDPYANTKAIEFFTAYFVEKSLSIDNLFVFLTIFSILNIPKHFQPKIILLGIGGAIIARTLMVFVGLWLIQQFSWILYLFGILLLITGIKMLISTSSTTKEKTTEEKTFVDTFLSKLEIRVDLTKLFFKKMENTFFLQLL